MKRGISMIVAIFATVLMAAPAMALSVVNSKHNLSTTAMSGQGNYVSNNEDEICVFCHTPHGAKENVPLWNRSGNTGTFALYTASATLTSETKGAVVDNTNISYKCMTCHDGVTGLGSGVWNPSNDTGTDPVMQAPVSGTLAAAGFANIGDTGGNLTNDHPVGFDYTSVDENAAAGDTDIKGFTTVTAAGIKFYNSGAGSNQMECASCHNVHNNEFSPFLRVDNAGSGLCLTCHQK